MSCFGIENINVSRGLRGQRSGVQYFVSVLVNQVIGKAN